MVETIANKVVVMASVFPPQKKGGGPAVSISNFVRCLEDHSRIYIISHNYEINSKDRLENVIGNSWTKYEDINVCYLNYKDNTIKNIYKLLCEIKPSHIYQNSYFTYEQTIASLLYKKFGDKSVNVLIAPRGEFGIEKLKLGTLKKNIYHRVLKYCGLLANVKWQGSGEQDVEDIKRFVPIDEVVDLNDLPCIYEVPEKHTPKEKNEIRLVTIGRIHPIKNIQAAIESLSYVKSNVIFDIYGPIEDEDYWKKCSTKINQLPKNVVVNYRDFLEHDKISETFSHYHAFFSPTCGENFGQSIVDAMLNATPVIISNQTPWSGVSACGGGFSIELKDIKKYTDAIDYIAGLDQKEYDAMCNAALSYIKETIDIEKIIGEYNELFK